MSRNKATQKTVLVVIEDPTVRDLVSLNVQQAGMYAMAVGTLPEGRRLASEVLPDVILLDLDAAGGGNTDLLGGFTRLGSHSVTTVMLSSKTVTACGDLGRACGASMCVQKPFSPADLIEQITLNLRDRPLRVPSRVRASKLRYGVLEVDVDCMTATVQCDDGPRTVDLPVTEMKLLQYLVNNAHRANRREDILADVWGDESSVDLRTIDQYIRRLRRSFERIGAAELIRTVYGLGYRIEETLAPPVNTRRN